MSVNIEFEQRWAQIETVIEKIINSSILPITFDSGTGEEAITLESFKTQMAGLREQKFTIAVCGAVKAGKSTLLNSLLFGDTVLPVFVTPMTAKLTFIQYTENKPYFEAEFYDKNEWDEIRNNLGEIGCRQLDERVQFCAEKFNVNWRNFIKENRRENIERHDLNELSEFVSVPKYNNSVKDNCGKYTPFVKKVSIYIKDENIKNLQIVDTPGLNDSNIINSRQTTEWISNAHALIYLTETRGPNDEDIKFFEHYFPSSAVEARIIVQNKIDTSSGYQSVISEIKKLGKQEKYQKMGMFGPDETLCSYSGALALARTKKSKGIMLTEEEEMPLTYDWISDDFNHDPDHLSAKIASKLYEREGKIRIERAIGEVLKIYDLNIAKNRSLAVEKEVLAKDCVKKAEDRAKEIKDHNDFFEKLDSSEEEIRANLDFRLEQILSTLEAQFHNAEKDIVNHAKHELAKMNTTDTIIAMLPWEVKRATKIAFSSIRPEINKAKQSLHKILDDNKVKLKEIAAECKVYDGLITEYIKVDHRSILDITFDRLLSKTNRACIQKPLPKYWFTDLFYKIETVRAEALAVVEKGFIDIDECAKEISNELREKVNKQVSNLMKRVKAWSDDRRAQLNRTSNDLKENVKHKTALEQEIRQYKERTSRLESDQKELKLSFKRAL